MSDGTPIERITNRRDAENILKLHGVPEVTLTKADFYSRTRFDAMKNPKFFMVSEPRGMYTYGRLIIVTDTQIQFCSARFRAKRSDQKAEYAKPYLWDLDNYDHAPFTALAYENGEFFYLRGIGKMEQPR